MSHRSISNALELPCGVVLKNRIIKSAMSDSLGDGTGHPTPDQIQLYSRWAQGGVAAMLIGEVQCSPFYAEKPGNLVLNHESESALFKQLAENGSTNNTQLWLQLGHAGAMAHPPISKAKGPSEINIPGLQCEALSLAEIEQLPEQFASTARIAQEMGFGGVQVHAAHGFLLSQFLSPLFNKRDDAYGGSINARMKLLMDVVNAVRGAVDPSFVVAVKLNATDQLEGGLEHEDALEVVSALNNSAIDLLEISGGTYFPGAKSASDATSSGPYFVEFAERAKKLLSNTPIMVTGGFKTLAEAESAIASGAVDCVGLARALVLEPDLPSLWLGPKPINPSYPRFSAPPEGGITAWYSMRLTEIAQGQVSNDVPDLDSAIRLYNFRDAKRVETWRAHFND